MKERPMIFNDEMVRAILDGRKTQTRRPVKFESSGRVRAIGSRKNWHIDDPNVVLACPYGQFGDRLWVREAWATDELFDTVPPSGIKGACEQSFVFAPPLWYAASDDWERGDFTSKRGETRQAQIMPRWASRITLEITAVRVERVQDISVEDCIAEGLRTVFVEHDARCDLREQFATLWDSIYGGTEYAWAHNRPVWVYEFRRVEK